MLLTEWIHLHNFTMNSSHDNRCLVPITHVILYTSTLPLIKLNGAKLGRRPTRNGLILWRERHRIHSTCSLITFSVIIFCFVCILQNDVMMREHGEREREGGGDEVETRMGELSGLRSLFSALKISEVGRPNLHLCKFN